MFVARPNGGFVASFISKNATVRKGETTHLNLIGGKLAVPDSLQLEFELAYSKDVESGSAVHCLTEIASPVAPFYADLDVVDSRPLVDWQNDDSLKEESAGWCSAAARAISKVTVSEFGGDDFFGKARHSVDKALELRASLDPKTVAVITAPPRKVKGGTKVGIHLIWPNLLVTRQDAKRLRNMIVVELYEEFPGRNWGEILDLSVYHDKSSLRMIGAYKPRTCEDCDDDDTKDARKAEYKMRSKVVKILNLQKGAGIYDVKKALAASSKKALRDEYFQVCERIKCETCNGRTKVPDERAGCYQFRVLLDETGCALPETDDFLEDVFTTVHLCSVKRPEGVEAAPLTFPERTPSPPEMLVIRKPKISVSGEELSEEEIVVEAPPKARFPKMGLLENQKECESMAEEWIRSGVFGKEYDCVQVSGAYRLLLKRKGTALCDGTPNYLVVVTLRGYGSQYCHAIKGEHGGNHVYFSFNSDGYATQRCHSSHDPRCEKGGPIVEVPFDLYTSLYPYSSKTINVLPKEINAWISGSFTFEKLRKQFSSLFAPPSRTDGGIQFLKIVNGERQARLRERNRELKVDDPSALGKRERDDSFEFEEEEFMWG
jgi:hypothetical protein